jgi:hypothetical protein
LIVCRDVVAEVYILEPVGEAFLDCFPTVDWSRVRDENRILGEERSHGRRVVVVKCLIKFLIERDKLVAAANYQGDRLAKQDPSNGVWQFDLFVSYDDLGSLLLAQGNLNQAKVQGLNGRAIIEKLVKQDPGNTDWQYDLSISHEDLGDIYRAQKVFRTRLSLAKRLGA